MIKSKLKELMKDYNINISELSNLTGLARTTITPLVNSPENITSLSVETIDTLCDLFGVNVEDLIEFQPSKNKYETRKTYWISLSEQTVFIILKKHIGKKIRYIIIGMSFDTYYIERDDVIDVRIEPVSKKDIENLPLKELPSSREIIEGKLFMRDFNHQNEETKRQTTRLLLLTLINDPSFIKKYPAVSYFDVTWNKGSIFNLEHYMFKYENGKLVNNVD